MNTATIDNSSGPTIGIFRRPASCEADRRRSGAVEPNYTGRRIVAALVLGVVVVLVASALSSLLASLGGVPASAAETRPAVSSVSTHVARPGDTMWSISAAYHGDVEPSRYLDALIRLNGGSAIIAGQAVQLP